MGIMHQSETARYIFGMMNIYFTFLYHRKRTENAHEWVVVYVQYNTYVSNVQS